MRVLQTHTSRMHYPVIVKFPRSYFVQALRTMTASAFHTFSDWKEQDQKEK